MSKLLSLSNNKPVNPYEFDVRRDFEPEVAARSLSNICRYVGHHGWMSVAEHSLIVANIMRFRWDYSVTTDLQHDWRMLGLLHDSMEMLFGDIPTPVKSHPNFDFLRALENKYLREVFTLHKLFPTRTVLEELHTADRFAMSIELEHLGQYNNPTWYEHFSKYPREQYPHVNALGIEASEAEGMWLLAYNNWSRV
jgi:hypothetical protein